MNDLQLRPARTSDILPGRQGVYLAPHVERSCRLVTAGYVMLSVVLAEPQAEYGFMISPTHDGSTHVFCRFFMPGIQLRQALGTDHLRTRSCSERTPLRQFFLMDYADEEDIRKILHVLEQEQITRNGSI